MDIRTGIARGKASGNRAGWIPESREDGSGDSRRAGVCAESLAGAEELAGAGEISGSGEIAGVIGSDVPWLECPACNALTWVITVTE